MANIHFVTTATANRAKVQLGMIAALKMRGHTVMVREPEAILQATIGIVPDSDTAIKAPDLLIVDTTGAEDDALRVLRDYKGCTTRRMALTTQATATAYEEKLGDDGAIIFTMRGNEDAAAKRGATTALNLLGIQGAGETNNNNSTFWFEDGTSSFDCEKGIVIGPNGRPIELTKNETGVLFGFMSQPHMVLNKDQIIEYSKMFDTSIVSEDDVPALKIADVWVCRLRKRLDEAGLKGKEEIKTKWGRGYTHAPERRNPPAEEPGHLTLVVGGAAAA